MRISFYLCNPKRLLPSRLLNKVFLHLKFSFEHLLPQTDLLQESLLCLLFEFRHAFWKSVVFYVVRT